MDLSTLKKLTSDGKIFGATFTKRTDGTERKMVARLGVHATGDGSRFWNPDEKDLLQVYDMQKQGFRMIPMEGLTELRLHGEVIKI